MLTERVFQPGLINYEEVAQRYPDARAFSQATADLWESVLKPFIPLHPHAVVLDLGCGAGRFSSLIADRFDATVIGLDASARMIQAATLACQSDRVRYSLGLAEALPLAGHSCDLVLLSQVIHHVSDRDECARELRRVIKPAGCVLIRSSFGDRLDTAPTYFRFFPGARRIVSQFPTVHDVLASFRSAGFHVAGFQTIPQKVANNLTELAERTRRRADTTLILLSDPEYLRCQTALERAAAAERVPEAVIEYIDLVVLKSA